ncbi:hypothetical protein EVAR_51753_1 [Eumeta japonica]|uniref:Uncharacterized protein n=1 Tax=Eumeta variegata TaxID=151549 RepID=A0A4C1XC44_EUMVA|nr:hypothetical protein EVAR_51753_1 [Eumeta japonica]
MPESRSGAVELDDCRPGIAAAAHSSSGARQSNTPRRIDIKLLLGGVGVSASLASSRQRGDRPSPAAAARIPAMLATIAEC